MTNTELFRKMMRVSRRLRHSAGHPGHGKFMHGMHGMPGMHAMPGMPGMHMHKGPGMMPMHGPECAGRKHRGMSREGMLVIISEYPNGVRQKELAEYAGINASSASEVVNKLEDDGYIVRTIDETDRRATILKLTELGEARANEIRDEREAMFDEVFGKLSEEEKETLSALLDKILED